jgi:FtsP/CotA-like multicopper oxidase with cupredoxin domain
MHLHGHDFLIVGQSPARTNPLAPGQTLTPYNDATDRASLTVTNPTRRDSTVLPAWGWLIVAFNTNNPGAWLFHCHVSWHAGEGLSIQYLERLGDIPGAMPLSSVTPNCNTWRAFYPANAPFKQHDSGI